MQYAYCSSAYFTCFWVQSRKRKRQGAVFRADESTATKLSSEPLLADPYEQMLVYVAQSPIAGNGLFARQAIPADTLVAFYNGIRCTHSKRMGKATTRN